MIGAMTDGGAAPSAEAMIERAVQLRREAAGLRQRLEAVTRHADTTSGRVQEARDRLTDESEDVARLESLSWTRILSTLKGMRSRPWRTPCTRSTCAAERSPTNWSTSTVAASTSCSDRRPAPC